MYQEKHKKWLEEFITTGKLPSGGIFFPSTLNGILGDYGSLPLT
jgi:hypothetical protein